MKNVKVRPNLLVNNNGLQKHSYVIIRTLKRKTIANIKANCLITLSCLSYSF